MRADGTGTRQQGVWGGKLASDLEVADAEMAAIHEYLWSVVREAGADAAARRVLVQSDCRGALDAIEAAWRATAALAREPWARLDDGVQASTCDGAASTMSARLHATPPAHSEGQQSGRARWHAQHREGSDR